MSGKTFGEKLTPKGFANCKPTPLVGLQVALFHHALVSVQLVQMQILQQNSQINRLGTMPAKEKRRVRGSWEK